MQPHDGKEDVVAMDDRRGPLVVRVAKDEPRFRLALHGLEYWLFYVTYERTAERDGHGRPIYRMTACERG